MRADRSRSAYDRVMRWILVFLAVLTGACTASDIELESYSIGDTAFVRTHCAVADPVLRAESADALPQRGQTELDRVTTVLAESRSELLAAYDALDAAVVARRGQVWTTAGDGLVRIEDADDYLIVITISGDALCPTAPISWNGVPIAVFRDGFLR